MSGTPIANHDIVDHFTLRDYCYYLLLFPLLFTTEKGFSKSYLHIAIKKDYLHLLKTISQKYTIYNSPKTNKLNKNNKIDR